MLCRPLPPVSNLCAIAIVPKHFSQVPGPVKPANQLKVYTEAVTEVGKKILKTVHSLTVRVEPMLDGTVAKLPFSIFNALVEIIETAEDNTDQIKELLEKIEFRLDAVEYTLSLAGSSEQIKNCAGMFVNSLKEFQKKLDAIQGKATWKQVLQIDGISEKIQDCVEAIDEFTEKFSLNLMISIYHDTSVTKHITQSSNMLGSWPIYIPAWYNTNAGPKVYRNGCTPQTRISICQRIHTWATNSSSQPIFWLSGMAGTGKSSIAYSIAENFENNLEKCCLSASFFCSRQIEQLREIKYIIPTIAYQIAERNVAFAQELLLVKSETAHADAVDKQIDELLVQPWQRSLKKQLRKIPVFLVIIDALDEIERGHGSNLIESLIQSINNIANGIQGIKFLITSRPDPGIIDRCQKQVFHPSYILENVDPRDAIEDVKHFLHERLPEHDHGKLDQIALLSQGLFIYAATVVRYIQPEEGEKDSQQEQNSHLDAMLEEKPSPEHLGEDGKLLIDSVYELILAEGLGKKGTNKFARHYKVLLTIQCAQKPLSVASISSFTEENKKEKDLEAVQIAINAFHAVMYISDKDKCVYVYHKSFLDFLSDESRSKMKLELNVSDWHASMARVCFTIMTSSLHFNMCNLPSSFLMDADVENLEERVKEKFDNLLEYCCFYWNIHMKKGNDLLKLIASITPFVKDTSLFWIEAMNLLEHKTRSYEMIRDVKRWILQSSNHSGGEVLRVLNALELVALLFTKSQARLSTPHLYLSVLATEFVNEKLPEQWMKSFTKLPKVQCMGVSNHGGEIMKIGISSVQCDLAFSHRSGSQ
ncbi:hypothetical protein BT96DRAFT_692325 [Gymnopus androsaceus JB14]|uniref:Nephrocystin 3-like N-terminal domain-containing protein n=1 Tax=Gymnopus androsaceus JB14 TaxID=1447944 RepID=A0A6A4HQ08_9AGAR|nr:hypothetical protein BT96DRAFT_692325 [Gymnopus androsaceus JB14]